MSFSDVITFFSETMINIFASIETNTGMTNYTSEFGWKHADRVLISKPGSASEERNKLVIFDLI